jgi:hypothetical protein
MMDTVKKRQIFSLDRGSREEFQVVEGEDNWIAISGSTRFQQHISSEM